MNADFARLKQEMRRKLEEKAGQWVHFTTLAIQICGDPTMAGALTAIALAEPELFVVQRERVVKLNYSSVSKLDQTKPIADQYSASRAVRQYASQLRQIVLTVQSVGPGHRILDKFLHELEIEDVDDDLRLTDDTPVEFKSQGAIVNRGHVAGIGRDNGTIFVSLEHEAQDSDLPATLIVHSAKIWFSLADALEGLQGIPARARDLLGAPRPGGTEERDSWLAGFHLPDLEPPWTRLLWGPPGAGKTYALAHFCATLLTRRTEREDRILIVAPSNVAVDVAIKQVVQALEKKGAGTALIAGRSILRYGYPRDQVILSRSELLGPSDLDGLSEEIAVRSNELRRMKHRRAPEAEIAAQQSIIRQLSENKRKSSSAHVANCRLVGATIASLMTPNCPILTGGPWQTVIVDEASMVSGAAILFLASVAEQRLLLAGDPRQLGPVFEWGYEEPPPSIQRWIAMDPYELAGVSTGAGMRRTVNVEDGRLIRITTQRRCHPDLWSFVSPFYPNVATDVVRGRLDLIADIPPLRGDAIAVLDVSSTKSPRDSDISDFNPMDAAVGFVSACRKKGKTWENPPTAMLAIDVAREIKANRPEYNIAIITPYRGQVRLIRRWLDEEIKSSGPRMRQVNLDLIDVGTVHAFQGSEADIVIFDPVDGSPRSSLGILHRGDSGMRLTNVAITRAKGKLIVLADKRWFKNIAKREDMPLMWDLLFSTGAPHACNVLPPVLSDDGFGLDSDKTESPIESMLLEALRQRQGDLPPFCLQHRILNEKGRIVSRADFAFVAQKLAIYVDGAKFHLADAQWRRDLRLRRELTRLDWRHLAFSGREIVEDSGVNAAGEIVSFIKRR